ncbi:hypothetical protein FRC00_008824 [Tulasnella sp. 408]|nr:hypothetical protein FRC00_008824 [Tulasnella sp. 408]
MAQQLRLEIATPANDRRHRRHDEVNTWAIQSSQDGTRRADSPPTVRVLPFNAQGSIAEKGAAADAFNLASGFEINLAVVQSAPGDGPGNATEQTKTNFNKCSPPTIVFAAGIDGCTEESFVLENRQDYPQGSALNGNIVTCDTLVNKCDANIVAINDCGAAQQATAGLSGQAFADAFNAAVTKNL